MTQTLVKIIADFNTTLVNKTAVGATTATLTTATDDDGVAIPTGTYGFTIDRNNSSKEFFTATLTGTALTDIKTITRGTGLGTAGLLREHRKGAEIVITDWVAIKRILSVLDGTTDLDSATPLKYDGTASITLSNQLATKAYADGLAIAGSPDSSTTVKGITKMSVAPASASNPIAVGDNDPRVPSQTENDALVGTSGTPSTSNPYVTLEGLVVAGPTGMIAPFAGFTAPTGWLLADGTAVSRTTYATLFSLINPSLGTATMTIASPCVVSLTAHGLVLDDIIYFTTTGALPTGLAINTRYYVLSSGLTADAFQISATKWGSAINTSGSQSGTHTLRRSPYGVGDGTTTFNVPNLKGSVPVGRDAAQTEFNAVGETGGEKTHTMTLAELVAHTHNSTVYTSASGWPITFGNFTNTATPNTISTSSTGSTTPFNVLQPYIALNYIIKT